MASDTSPPSGSSASGAPQRRWQAACPNCGATVEFASAASASAVCSYCRSSLLREGEALRKIGISAELIEDYSPLQIGASGRYAGAPFTVVGRQQIAYAEGSWNEWHVLFDGGPAGPRSGWLAEDNGSYVMAFEAPLPEAAPKAQELILDRSLQLADQRWTVAAVTRCHLRAAQGELPRPPQLGAERQYLVAELRGPGNEVGSLDFSPGLASSNAAPIWSIGRSIRLDAMAMQGLRDDLNNKDLKSRSLECPSCGAALTPSLSSTRSIVCGQCHAVVDISQGAGADLEHYAQNNGMEPQLRLGSTGMLQTETGQAITWQVVGYQERCDLPESSEDEQTFWREYLLYNKIEGFAFLVDTEEGWSLVRPLTGAPVSSRGDRIDWGGKSYKKRWTYQAKVTYVLGEFYWQVSRDQRTLVSDYEGQGEARQMLLSREQTENEVVWSLGRKLDAAVVARAFKLAPERAAALGRDASSLSDGGGLLRKIVIAFFILLILVLLLRACSSDDCQAYKDSYGEASSEYQQCRKSSGARYGTSGGSYGGSYGGYSSGGGGHK
ncbi:DUF4178 domain-containing protein [Paucibacter sp. B51]|uniref:DUF4178 domain-containing protein n=1 Tax=Paucibacter sp. B51 TaxID=2993315 RepID=UPI0022EBCDE6|nr:DUF4178 domain-containing protein [Paucibacter sp. B51]